MGRSLMILEILFFIFCLELNLVNSTGYYANGGGRVQSMCFTTQSVLFFHTYTLLQTLLVYDKGAW